MASCSWSMPWSSTPTLLLPLLHFGQLLHHQLLLVHLLHQVEQKLMVRLSSCPDSMMFSSWSCPITSFWCGSRIGVTLSCSWTMSWSSTLHRLRRLRFCPDSIVVVSCSW